MCLSHVDVVVVVVALTMSSLAQVGIVSFKQKSQEIGTR
jgi:hypothetical protein